LKNYESVKEMLADDLQRVLGDLQKGLRSKKHRDFIERFNKQ
jgi:hypothetical protein